MHVHTCIFGPFKHYMKVMHKKGIHIQDSKKKKTMDMNIAIVKAYIHMHKDIDETLVY